MKLINKTELDTRSLQKLLTAVAKSEHLTPLDKKQIVLEVDYRRRSDNWSDSSMPVTYWGKGKWKFVGRVVKGVKELDSVQAAKSIGLAIAGAQGWPYSHSNPVYGWGKGWQDKWAWAKQYPVKVKEKKEPAEPTAKDLAIDGMSHCLEQIMLWEKKAKLAQTKLRIWNRKLKRLTNREAKAIEAAQVVEPPKAVVDMVGEIKKMEDKVAESMAIPKELME